MNRADTDRFLRFAEKVSAEVLSHVQRRCAEHGYESAEGAFVLTYAIGRLSGRHGDREMTPRQIWSWVGSDEMFEVFEGGYKAEKH